MKKVDMFFLHVYFFLKLFHRPAVFYFTFILCLLPEHGRPSFHTQRKPFDSVQLSSVIISSGSVQSSTPQVITA